MSSDGSSCDTCTIENCDKCAYDSSSGSDVLICQTCTGDWIQGMADGSTILGTECVVPDRDTNDVNCVLCDIDNSDNFVCQGCSAGVPLNDGCTATCGITGCDTCSSPSGT